LLRKSCHFFLNLLGPYDLGAVQDHGMFCYGQEWVGRETKTAPAPYGGRAEAVLACVQSPPDLDITPESCRLFPASAFRNSTGRENKQLGRTAFAIDHDSGLGIPGRP
jgi:hypothetical protein